MRLADFIVRDMEAILADGEAFARTLLPAADGMDSLALRDHARQILHAVAIDLGTAQSRVQQSEKSMGRAPVIADAPETAAQTHAVLRARDGFDINQLVAEYRALRASVLRKWMDHAELDETGVEDIIRFNEAVDQAVAESVGHFHRSIERYRNLLLGMLGHDMRSPLATITMTARFLGQLNAGKQISEAAERLIRSGASMQALLDDLTDFNRTNLGLGLKMSPTEIDLAKVVDDELDQFRAAHPQRQFELNKSGQLRGRWDGIRVQQLLRNLISNAVRYGSVKLPVHINLCGEEPSVLLEVTNGGQIDPSEVGGLFEPLKQGTSADGRDERREGLGLGLFIVKEIAKAHGGDVQARCEQEQTTFAVRLPRESSASAS